MKRKNKRIGLFIPAMFFCLSVTASVTAETKSVSIVDGTSMSVSKSNTATYEIQTDESGRISKITQESKPPFTIDVSYDEGSCSFGFVDGTGVRIDVVTSWTDEGDGQTKIKYLQTNQVPKTVINKVVYPAKTIQKSIQVQLSAISSTEYQWKEALDYSWLPDDGRSSYECHVGKDVIWRVFDAKGRLKYTTILDGHTSDASKESTSKMFYSGARESYSGRFFWAYEPSTWNEATWIKGGTMTCSGEYLVSSLPMVNVINFYILKAYRYNAAWEILGPSLFGIPIH